MIKISNLDKWLTLFLKKEIVMLLLYRFYSWLEWIGWGIVGTVARIQLTCIKVTENFKAIFQNKSNQIS